MTLVMTTYAKVNSIGKNCVTSLCLRKNPGGNKHTQEAEKQNSVRCPNPDKTKITVIYTEISEMPAPWYFVISNHGRPRKARQRTPEKEKAALGLHHGAGSEAAVTQVACNRMACRRISSYYTQEFVEIKLVKKVGKSGSQSVVQTYIDLTSHRNTELPPPYNTIHVVIQNYAHLTAQFTRNAATSGTA